MKNAELWKRIVREGIENHLPTFVGGEFVPAGIPETLGDEIAAATIVMAPFSPHAHISEDGESDSVQSLISPLSPPPFPSMFVEFSRRENDCYQYGHYLTFKDDVDGGWAMDLWDFLAGPVPPRLTQHSRIRLDRDARVINESFERPHSGNEDDIPQFRDAWTSLAVIQMSASLEVLAMMGCKNVSLEPRDVPEKTKLGAKRHGGEPHPSFRYHVLTVRPAGARSDGPGIEIGTMPRHVCRGHFSEYGPEFGKGLLFGKYARRFFIPPHMRGDKKNGVVEKDYEVRPTNVG